MAFHSLDWDRPPMRCPPPTVHTNPCFVGQISLNIWHLTYGMFASDKSQNRISQITSQDFYRTISALHVPITLQCLFNPRSSIWDCKLKNPGRLSLFHIRGNSGQKKDIYSRPSLIVSTLVYYIMSLFITMIFEVVVINKTCNQACSIALWVCF